MNKSTFVAGESRVDRYEMRSLKINALVGRQILSAQINAEKDFVLLETDSGPLYLTWAGDCCAQCFLANVSGADALVGATILEAAHASWQEMSRDEDDYDYKVIESMGTKIKTTKGYVTLESRVSHNGYYGGEILVSDDQPMNQYSCPVFKPGQTVELSPLVDF